MNLFNYFKTLLKELKFIYLNVIILVVGALASLINFSFLGFAQAKEVEGILLSMLLVIYLSILVLLKSNKPNNERNAFEQRGEKFKSELIENSEVYWEYNISTKEINISEKWIELTGNGRFNKHNIKEFLQSKIFPEDIKELLNNWNNYIEERTPSFECDFRMISSKGSYNWYNIKGIKQMGISSNMIISGIISNISSRKDIEDKINYMAYYDSLTGLPNKIFFQNYLKNLVENGKGQVLKGAVIIIDVDDFKNVNDTLGHDYGDQLLKIIAELIRVTFGDNSLIARAGGDEFLFLIENYKETEEIIVICEGIIRMLNNPIEIGDKSLYTSVSMGITFYLNESFDISGLIKNAETAMYKSKETGKNKYCFYDLSMGQELERRMKIGNLLREAIFKEELSIVYQPQYNIKTNEILSIEALIRWNNKELGYISPAEFIHIAESNGTISNIGKWVLEEVCRQNSIWKRMGYTYNSIAVNISPIQLQDEAFVSHIKETILTNKIDPASLEIEITESLLLGNMQLSERKLHAIKNFGVKIAIDDFGTGYSSLNYLTFLPLDTLKIDKSFIDNITILNNDRILAQNIIKLSHDLDMKVVAEGVETKEQLEVLSGIDCDIIQGYYLSKPLSREDIEVKLNKTVIARNGVDINGRIHKA